MADPGLPLDSEVGHMLQGLAPLAVSIEFPRLGHPRSDNCLLNDDFTPRTSGFADPMFLTAVPESLVLSKKRNLMIDRRVLGRRQDVSVAELGIDRSSLLLATEGP